MHGEVFGEMSAILVAMTVAAEPGPQPRLMAHIRLRNTSATAAYRLPRVFVHGLRGLYPAGYVFQPWKQEWHFQPTFHFSCPGVQKTLLLGPAVFFLGDIHDFLTPKDAREWLWHRPVELPPGATLDTESRLDQDYALPYDPTNCVVHFEWWAKDRSGKDFHVQSPEVQFFWPGREKIPHVVYPGSPRLPGDVEDPTYLPKKAPPPKPQPKRRKVGAAPYPAEPEPLNLRPARVVDNEVLRASQGKGLGEPRARRDPESGLYVENLRIATIVRRRGVRGM